MLPDAFSYVLVCTLTGGAVILAVLLLRWLGGRRLSPALRCALWLPVAVLLVAPRLPHPGWTWQKPEKPVSAIRTRAVARNGDGAVTTTITVVPVYQSLQSNTVTNVDAEAWLPALWCLGVLGLGLRWAWSYRRLCRQLKKQSQPVPEALRMAVKRAASTMKLRRVPQVCVSSAISSPAVLGLLRPTVVVPPALMSQLTEEELQLVLMHECGHVRRHDLISHWVSLLLVALHWFNPLAWIAARLLRADREAACDASVLDAMGSESRRSYGHTLLKIASSLLQERRNPLLAGVLGSVDLLKSRVVEIGRHGSRSVRAGRMMSALTLLAAGGVAVLAAEPPKPDMTPRVTTTTTPAPTAPPAANGDILVRIYKVSPDFLSNLTEPGDPDPFSPGGGKPVVKANATAQEVLAASGVSFPAGASAHYSPVTSQLVVRNTVANLEQIERVVADLRVKQEKAHRMVFVTAKLIGFDEKLLGQQEKLEAFVAAFTGVIAPQKYRQQPALLPKGKTWTMFELTDPQFQVFIRTVAGKERTGVADLAKDLVTLPSITVRTATRASMEIVKEFIYPTEYEPSKEQGGALVPKTFEMKPLGFRMELEPVITDDLLIDLHAEPELNALAEMREFKADNGETIKIPSFMTMKLKDASWPLPSGMTRIYVGEAPLLERVANDKPVERGRMTPVILCVTASVIDPGGKPVPKPDKK